MSFAKLGSQHTVNATIDGDQNRSAVTQLLNGDIVVAWTDTNGTAINVRGQILNANGVTRDGSEFMLNTTLTGSQYDVSLTALGNGGFAAGWTSGADWSNSPFDFADDASQRHVVTQVFAADGDKVGGEDTHALFIYDYSFLDDYLLPDIELTDHLQGSTALTANLAVNSDDFDLIAVDEVHYTDSQLFLFAPPIPTGSTTRAARTISSDFPTAMRKFSTTGSTTSPTRTTCPIVSLSATTRRAIRNSTAFMLPRPSRCRTAPSSPPMRGTLGGHQRLLARERNQNRLRARREPGHRGLGLLGEPRARRTQNGNIIVVWEDGDVGGGVDNIVGQLFSPGGTKIGGEFTINSSSSNTADPAVAALTDGQFIVVWEDMAGDGSGSAIKGQVFTSGGVKSGEAFTVNTSTTTTRSTRPSRPSPMAMRS